SAIPSRSRSPSLAPRDLHSFPTRRSSDLLFPTLKMARYLLRRFAQMAGVFLVFLTLLFALLHAMPGDITNKLIGDPSIPPEARIDRKSTRLNSSHVKISYAVFCLKKKK